MVGEDGTGIALDWQADDGDDLRAARGVLIGDAIGTAFWTLLTLSLLFLT